MNLTVGGYVIDFKLHFVTCYVVYLLAKTFSYANLKVIIYNFYLKSLLQQDLFHIINRKQTIDQTNKDKFFPEPERNLLGWQPVLR